jgi:hypothetical protein
MKPDDVLKEYYPQYESAAAYVYKAVKRRIGQLFEALDLPTAYQQAHGWYNSDFERLMTANFGQLIRGLFDEYLAASDLNIKDYPYDAEATIAEFHADFLESFTNRITASDLWRLYYLLQEEDHLDRIEQQLDLWVEKKPAQIASNETVRGSNAIYATMAFGLGFSLVWRTRSDRCPYCATLAGRTIGNGGAFAEGGDILKPKGRSKMRIYGTVRHAPVHRGCRCYVQAVKG